MAVAGLLTLRAIVDCFKVSYFRSTVYRTLIETRLCWEASFDWR